MILKDSPDRTLTFTSMDSRPQTPSEILDELVTTLRTSLTPVTSPPAASGSPMALPASYAVDAAECGGFLLQVALFMEMQPQRFSTERTKVAFLISLLTVKALLWARAIWNANSFIINSYDAFTNHFKVVFSSATGALAVSDQLLRLTQGYSTTSDYTLQFRMLAASSGWNEAALLSAYRHGLNPHIRTAMSIYDDTIGLENFMQRANRISQRLSACQPNEATHQLVSPTTRPPVPEPMQVDSTHLARAERVCHIAAGLCLYCGLADHFIQNCPVRPPRPAVSTIQLEPEITTLSLLPVQLLTPDHSVAVSALVDSGSSGNFISQDLLSRLHLPRRRHAQELRV